MAVSGMKSLSSPVPDFADGPDSGAIVSFTRLYEFQPL